MPARLGPPGAEPAHAELTFILPLIAGHLRGGGQDLRQFCANLEPQSHPGEAWSDDEILLILERAMQFRRLGLYKHVSPVSLDIDHRALPEALVASLQTISEDRAFSLNGARYSIWTSKELRAPGARAPNHRPLSLPQAARVLAQLYMSDVLTYAH